MEEIAIATAAVRTRAAESSRALIQVNPLLQRIPMNQIPFLDEQFMAAALAEGRKALPGCLPNPPVGCVLVRAGVIVASGFTQPPYQPHAEAKALAGLAGDGAGITVYVTLEPCAFHGRTPSCARALVERHVTRVVVGMLDPDPRNDGAGIALLREAGIEVEVGVLERPVARELGPYLWRAGDRGTVPGVDPPPGPWTPALVPGADRSTIVDRLTSGRTDPWQERLIPGRTG
jgi:pyrimidine deaminase RibD-like protein